MFSSDSAHAPGDDNATYDAWVNVVAFLTTSPELVADPTGPGILCLADLPKVRCWVPQPISRIRSWRAYVVVS